MRGKLPHGTKAIKKVAQECWASCAPNNRNYDQDFKNAFRRKIQMPVF